MAKVRFEHLYLLSTVERRALSVPLAAPKLVIQGGNGSGKSVILKAIWQTLGATPPSIDDRWKTAQVSSCLVFTLGGRRYAAVKSLSVHALFDLDRNELLFFGRRLVADWAPLLARQFGFKLQIADRTGEAVIPPPAYMFAPWYIDQDKGWSEAWDSFEDFYLPASRTTLADYHSGLKPNDYYEAQAELRRKRLELKVIEASITTLRDSIDQVDAVDAPAAPELDMAIFEAETTELIARSNTLMIEQAQHRRGMLDLHEELHLVRAERDLLRGALAEMRGEFVLATGIEGDVECPTCGVHYQNDLADRFGLIQDEQVITEAIGAAERTLAALSEREAARRRDLGRLEVAHRQVREVLDTRRQAVSLNDVMVAAGRTEAIRILRSGLDEKTLAARAASDVIDVLQGRMAGFTDRKRSKEIKDAFTTRLAEFAQRLDVALDPAAASLSGIRIARGSEGPRALLAYYYAFLHVSAKFSDGVRFPIVVDAPNQQGQDATHLPGMLAFILDQAPADSQIIVATEDVGDLDLDGVELMTVNSDRQVLRSEEFDAVSAVFKPFQDALLQAVAGASDGA
ncbi:MAG: hypothetical protein U9R70_12465 [Pseudomonadota bacterium]|nr:hypothetical protein [Pseudomonadota bacterium]